MFFLQRNCVRCIKGSLPVGSSGDAEKLLMLARGMAKKRLNGPEAAQQYTDGGPESGEAIRLYLQVLKVIAAEQTQVW